MLGIGGPRTAENRHVGRYVRPVAFDFHVGLISSLKYDYWSRVGMIVFDRR
jgi:hypothetical protein